MSDADRIAKLEARVEQLEAVIRALGAVFGSGGGGGAEAATDRELDHPQYGDPVVKMVPRDWPDKTLKGRKYSTCPPDFLDELASTFDYFAKKNEAAGELTDRGKPKADFDRRSARLCRGWARRLRSGWTPPPAPAVPSFGGGGGFGNSSSPAFSSGGGSFGGGHRGFLGTPPAAVPLPATPTSPEPHHDPDSFDFGANVAANPTTPPEDFDDDDPPL